MESRAVGILLGVLMILTHRSSTRPRGDCTVATSAGAGPAVTRRARPRSRNRVWTRSCWGCSACNDTSVAPAAAVLAGCGVDPQSMKKGTMPSATTSRGLVYFHTSRVPSGVRRLPAPTGPSATPCTFASRTSRSRSDSFAAHVTSRGCVKGIDPECAWLRGSWLIRIRPDDLEIGGRSEGDERVARTHAGVLPSWRRADAGQLLNLRDASLQIRRRIDEVINARQHVLILGSPRRCTRVHHRHHNHESADHPPVHHPRLLVVRSAANLHSIIRGAGSGTRDRSGVPHSASRAPITRT